ncbi:MAG: 50S ribosomal protein L6 [Clostridiales bacterium]|jgi:large subunit ribosomal protein L6|nr:50S ribosomal protein L6 [Eubacteriales bacterium]NLO15773.1 50S ribosomal protein L6 [Clostridiales bacterium]
MSRIGKLPIQVPAGVTVTVDKENVVTVKGPKGTLSQKVHRDFAIKQEEGVLTVERPSDSKPHKSLHGLYRSLINNLVVGVTTGFEKTLEIVGTGYRAQAEGKKLTVNAGYSNPVIVEAPDDITFETPAPTTIIVKGINKQVVGNLAADIRAIRKPEPYLGKGIKYKGEHIRRKEGKAGK